MTHLAFDLGLTTTGYCSATESDTFTCPNKYRSSPMTDERKNARLEWWRDTFTVLLAAEPGVDVWVEGPFVPTKNFSGAMEVFALHAEFRRCCIRNGSTMHVVPPTSLKLYATGKGNADKGMMMDAAWAAGWDGDDHNEADAYLLWLYGRDGGVRP